MRLTVTFLLCASLNLGHGQTWCPSGAEWLFNFTSQQATGVRHAWCSGDTVVGGLPCQRIDQVIVAYEPVFPLGQAFTFQGAPIITHGQGDLVLLWDGNSAIFDTLAWFGAAPGDHWDVPNYAGLGRFDVLDTGTRVVDGIPLRYLVVEEPIVLGVTDTLFERIGFEYYFLRPEETMLVDFTTMALVCYKDDQISQFNGWYQTQHPCDFTLAVREPASTEMFMYPNPGLEELTLALLPGMHEVSLTDARGRMVLRQRVSGPWATISARHLVKGAYAVRVDETNLRSVWVKQ